MVKLNNAWDLVNRLTENGENKTTLYDLYYKISNAIFKYRVNKNLSQKELAKRLGITQAMISKLESGIYNYTIEQLWKIAVKLDFDFDIVFQEKHETFWSVGNIGQEKIDVSESFNVLNMENAIKVA